MNRRRLAVFPALVAAVALGGACNSLTGADELSIGDDPGSSGGQGGATSGSGDGATTADTSTSTDVSTSTSTGGPAGSTGSGNPNTADASGVSITEVAIYQGVKRDIEKAGAASNSNIPIVANRDALFRIFTTVDGSYQGAPVTARVWINGAAFEATQTAKNSSDQSPASTFNVKVPAASMTAGSANMHVELAVDPGASQGPNPNAHYPASGDAPMNIQSSGQTLKITIVPVKYGGDGSNRLPDLSQSQLKAYSDRFLAIYPVPQVVISVHSPMAWGQTVDPNGNGWDTLLSAVADLRAQDGPPSDVYYYGAFDPDSSVNNYCGGGCVAGLGFIAGTGDPGSRAAIGLGFPQFAAETATHEVGHNHGRQHAPCGGAQGVDPSYPYGGAGIGVWGYDIVTDQLFNPSQYTDMMGYCNPTWVSDYTFKALFSRVKSVNGAQIVYPPDQMDRMWQRARIDSQGNIKFFTTVKRHEPPIGEAKSLTIETPNGSKSVVGHYLAFDHLDGGILMWEEDPALTGITIDIANKQFHAVK